MKEGELTEQRRAGSRELEEHLATVFGAPLAPNQSALLEFVHEAHGRVVLDAKPLGDVSNRWPRIPRKSLYGEQELVLLRLDAVAARRSFAEREELSDLVAKRGERAIVGERNVRHDELCP